MNHVHTENIDHQEIDKFSQLANEWWNPNGELKTLHDINPLRLNYIQQYADLAQAKVIDVGCGGGILSEALAKSQAIVTGIDMAEKSLAIAKQHSESEGLSIDYRCIAVEELAQQAAGQFDVVVCMEMLEHVPSPNSIIHACAALLKPQGHLFLSTLNRNNKSYAQAIVAAEYILQMLPRGTHDFNKFITPSELARMCRSANLEVKNLSGMNYSIFSRHYRLSRDTSVNYLLHAQKN